MSGPEDVYTSTLLKKYGYVATWHPGTPIQLGLIGRRGTVPRRGEPRPEGRITQPLAG